MVTTSAAGSDTVVQVQVVLCIQVPVSLPAVRVVATRVIALLLPRQQYFLVSLTTLWRH